MPAPDRATMESVGKVTFSRRSRLCSNASARGRRAGPVWRSGRARSTRGVAPIIFGVQHRQDIGAERDQPPYCRAPTSSWLSTTPARREGSDGARARRHRGMDRGSVERGEAHAGHAGCSYRTRPSGVAGDWVVLTVSAYGDEGVACTTTMRVGTRFSRVGAAATVFCRVGEHLTFARDHIVP